MDRSQSTTPSSQQFCLRWHNHQASLLSALPSLLDQSHLTDVTLSAEGRTIKAHKIILSACSTFFTDLFKTLDASQSHPVIIIPSVPFSCIVALLTFMYAGEVNVYEDQINALLSLAETLGIKGLADFNGNFVKSPLKVPSATPPPPPTPMAAASSQPPSPRAPEKSPSPARLPPSPIDSFFPRPLQFFPPLLTPQPLNFSRSNSFFPPGLVSSQFGAPSAVAASVKDDDEAIKKCGVGVGGGGGGGGGDRAAAKRIDKIAESLRSGRNYFDQSNFPKAAAAYAPPAASPTGQGGGAMKPQSGFPVQFLEDFKAENFAFEKSPLLAENLMCTPEALMDKPAVPKPSNSKLYATCFICNKQLSNQYNLRVHLETHSSQRYACQVCSHVSRSKDALRKHVSYRHPGTSTTDPDARRKRSRTALNASSGTAGPITPTTSVAQVLAQMQLHQAPLGEPPRNSTNLAAAAAAAAADESRSENL